MEVAGVPFDGPFTNTGSISPGPGIYLIMFRNLVLDVGESSDLPTRLANHDREKCWIEKGGADYSIFVHCTPGGTENERRQIEEMLRYFLDPVCGAPGG